MPVSKTQYNFIDLFAGAGGMSEGFISAGFNPVAHVEMNTDACLTLKTRLSYHYLLKKKKAGFYYKYLTGEIDRDMLYSMIPQEKLNTVIEHVMSKETMSSLFNKIDTLMKLQKIDNINLVTGGPPCQAYSLVGRAVKSDKMINDSRNYLYLLYCSVLRKYQPDMFVFENVPGLLTANSGKYYINMIKAFKRFGYEVQSKVLNAHDFNVLQKRCRVILIGWKKGTERKYPEFNKVSNKFLINDLFEDLPALQAGETCNTYKSDKINECLRKTGIRKEDDVLTWHTARPNIERDKDIYRRVIETWNTTKKRLRYSELPEELRTHKNATSFLDRFKVVASDLPASHTMMAHISKDGHYFIHPDISQSRSITVREAARIQAFPDNYYFEGSRTAVLTQIGNAVPPLMAKGIAKGIIVELERNG